MSLGEISLLRDLRVLHGLVPVVAIVPEHRVLRNWRGHERPALPHHPDEEGLPDVLHGPSDQPAKELLDDPRDLGDRDLDGDVHRRTLGTTKRAGLVWTDLQVQDHPRTRGFAPLIPEISSDHHVRPRESLVRLVGLLHGIPPSKCSRYRTIGPPDNPSVRIKYSRYEHICQVYVLVQHI